MDYSSQEALDDFHKKNKARKTDIFWGGAFNYTANVYLRLAFDYYLHRKETEYDNLIADYYIEIIERDIRKVFFEDKENVINLTTLIEKKGIKGDILKKLLNYINIAKKRYSEIINSGIIDTIEDCKNKLERNIQILE
jgi:site-specific DNA-adenine methylase